MSEPNEREWEIANGTIDEHDATDDPRQLAIEGGEDEE